MISKPPVGWDAESREQRLARQTVETAETAGAVYVRAGGRPGVWFLLGLFGLWLYVGVMILSDKLTRLARGELGPGDTGELLTGLLVILPALFTLRRIARAFRQTIDARQSGREEPPR